MMIKLIELGDLRGVKRLVLEDASVLESMFETEWMPVTPLMLASRYGQLEIIEWFLAQGVDIDSKTSQGATALLSASAYGQRDAVRLLVERGADLELEGFCGATALSIACCNDFDDMAQYLIEQGSNVNCSFVHDSILISCSVREQAKKSFKLLVDGGADLEATDTFGYTALMNCVVCGFRERTLYLVEGGANLDAQVDSSDHWLTCQCLLGQPHENVDGYTALMFACVEGDLDATRLLIEKGANVELLSDFGFDALELAKQNGYAELVALLEFVMYSEVPRVLQLELGLSREVVLAFFDRDLCSLDACKLALEADTLLLELCPSATEEQRIKIMTAFRK